MRVLNKKEVLENQKTEELTSLYSLAKNADSFLTKDQKNIIIDWINKINSQHHNDANFFKNFKSVFSINGLSQVIEGQEDIAGLEHNGIFMIVRQAEMGVAFGIKNTGGLIIEEDFVKIKDITDALTEGFNNPKNFHSKILFDTIKEDVKSKQIEKSSKFKL